VIAVILPAAFHHAMRSTNNVNPLIGEQEGHDVLSISHGVCKPPSVYYPSKLIAINTGCHYLASQSVLSLGPSYSVMTVFTFLVYRCYLWFQLISHRNLYDDDNTDAQQSIESPSSIVKRCPNHERRIPPDSSSLPSADGVIDPAQRDACSLEAGPEVVEQQVTPEMGLSTTIALLIIVTLVCRSPISLTSCLIVPIAPWFHHRVPRRFYRRSYFEWPH